MIRKLFFSLLALAALGSCAFAALAQAAPELTYPTGTRLAAGATLSITNFGESTTTDNSGIVLYRCGASTLTGELTKNNGTEVEANITKAEFTGTGVEHTCTSTMGAISTTTAGVNGVPWCFRATSAMGADEFQIRGGKCSEVPREIRYVIDIAPSSSCTYGRTEPLKGTFTTDTGASATDAYLHLTNQAFVRKAGFSLLCPAETKWDISYTMELDTISTADPLYFS
jgi:hypothetical protein